MLKKIALVTLFVVSAAVGASGTVLANSAVKSARRRQRLRGSVGLLGCRASQQQRAAAESSAAAFPVSSVAIARLRA